MSDFIETMLHVMGQGGLVSFQILPTGEIGCTITVILPHRDGRSVVHRNAADIESALQDAYRQAANVGFIGYMAGAPRVITRIMDDGVQTKDGAA